MKSSISGLTQIVLAIHSDRILETIKSVKAGEFDDIKREDGFFHFVGGSLTIQHSEENGWLAKVDGQVESVTEEWISASFSYLKLMDDFSYGVQQFKKQHYQSPLPSQHNPNLN